MPVKAISTTIPIKVPGIDHPIEVVANADKDGTVYFEMEASSPLTASNRAHIHDMITSGDIHSVTINSSTSSSDRAPIGFTKE